MLLELKAVALSDAMALLLVSLLELELALCEANEGHADVCWAHEMLYVAAVAQALTASAHESCVVGDGAALLLAFMIVKLHATSTWINQFIDGVAVRSKPYQ